MRQPANEGFSIIQVLIGAALLGILVMAVSGAIRILFKGQQILSKRNDLEGLRLSLTRDIDCNRTLTMAGGNLPAAAVVIPADCAGPVATRKSILLRDNGGRPLTAALLPGGVLRGAGRAFDQYYVHAYCDAANPSLVVRVAKSNGAVFATDPTTNSPFDFLKRPNPLFGTTAPVGGGVPLSGPPLCASSFPRSRPLAG